MYSSLTTLLVKAALLLPLVGLPGDQRPAPPAAPDLNEVVSADQLWSSASVPSFHLKLSTEAMHSLDRDRHVWVQGQFQTGRGPQLPVGVRLKGHRAKQSWAGKPAMKLHFGKFSKGGRFLGLKRLTLNNMVEDPTMLREHMAYRFFRAAGVPAPRTAYAKLYVNDEYYGLYLVLEAIDKQFLARHYPDNSGSLYEGEYGCDVYPADVTGFEQDSGDDQARHELATLAAAADQTPDALFELLDRDRVLAYLAASALLGDFDGYRHAHNYRLYYEPSSQRWSLLPWGLDRLFKRELEIYDSGGRIAKICFSDAACRADYARTLQRLATQLEQLDLSRAMWSTAQLIDHAAIDDPRRPYDLTKIATYRANMRKFLATRPQQVRDATSCIDGDTERDDDGDGFGCMDCDDHAPDIHPQAAELCDDVDNNCSGLVDDTADCGCPRVDAGGATFYLCDLPMTWWEAKQHCESLGTALARIDSEAQAQRLYQESQKLRKEKWWIGLTDSAQEARFLWSDGVQSPYTRWGKGEPDNDACNQDCAAIATSSGGRWHDTHCAGRKPFVCRQPPAMDD